MQTIGSRLQEARLAKGINQTALAKGARVSRSAVSQWERDDTVPTGINLVAAAAFLEVRAEWLSTGRGPMQANGEAPAELTYHPETDRLPLYSGSLGTGLIDIGETSFAAIPRFDMSISAGPGAMLDHHAEPLGFHLIERQFLSGVTRAMPEHLAILRVRGDSMRPTLDDGDWVLIDRSQTRLGIQGLYALRIGEQEQDIWVKRLSLNLADRKVRVISDNDAYPEEQVGEPGLDLIGRVVWIVGRRV